MQCEHPIHKIVRSVDGTWKVNIIPCGRCMACVTNKQNDYVQVYWRQASKCTQVNFVTLTYNDDHIPLMLNPVLPQDVYKTADDDMPCYASPTYNQRFTDVNNDDHFRKLYYIEKYERENYPTLIGKKNHLYYVCPSLRRQDVKDWLKIGRLRYEREFGRKLPDFKYSCVGEYGTRYQRPHYHILFFGLDNRSVEYLCNIWRNENGYALNKSIPRISRDGKDSFEAVSKYVAKYQNKGCFECENLKEGYVERPRVQISKNMVELSQQEMEWYRGVDFLGSETRPIGDYCLEELSRLQKRLFITINGKKYALGKHMKNKIFKKDLSYEKCNGEIRKKIVSDELQKALSEYIQFSITDEYLTEFRQLPVDSYSKGYSWFEVDKQMAAQKDNEESARLQYEKAKKFYARSQF